MCWDGLCNCGETYSSCPTDCGCGQGTNIAPQATASSSGGGEEVYERGPSELNDGNLQSTCTFHWITAGTSPGSSYIQLNWGTARTLWGFWIDSLYSYETPCSVNANRQLAGGTIQWWNGSSWVTVQSLTNQNGDWSYQFPGPITTTALRIYGIYAGIYNPVVFEWRVYACS
jgi:hypothetical protein